MQTVSTFNRNLVIFLVSLALINIAVGFYKSFNKSKSSSSTQINYRVKTMNLDKNEPSGMMLIILAKLMMLEILKIQFFS